MHVAVVIGTRPEAIKLAPVVHELHSQGVETSIISTGQHRDMLDQMLLDFGIEPDIGLSTMRPNQRLSDLTAVLVERLGDTLRKLAPDYLLVQGDTTSAMCGALCGFYEGIPVGHVEAGLRTGNLESPFPEEANRKLAAVLATTHFCPTEANKQNLLAEGVPQQAGQFEPAAEWATTEPSHYSEHADLLSSSPEAEHDLFERTQAALAAAGEEE